MSRIGKKPIVIPKDTEVTVVDNVVSVKGSHGQMTRVFSPKITITIADNLVTVTPQKTNGSLDALWGTTSSHITNMINGVNNPYTKKLIVEGVGFKAEVKGNELVMNLGFSHPVTLAIPEGLTATTEKEVISISGIDKEKVGHFASKVRLSKKPEPYKGKGIRYEDEVVRRKQGKKAITA